MFLGVFPFLALEAGVWAVVALAALVVMVAGHLCATGELFAARIALDEHRQRDTARILAHRREDVGTMHLPLVRPGKHSG